MTPDMAESILIGATRESLGLTVLYDDRCPLCRRLKQWLGDQPTLHHLNFLTAGSPEARSRFPALDHVRTARVLTVVTSDGAVYEGERAWLVCAWALPGWQPVAERLGSGLGLRVVRLATRAVDGYRHRLLADRQACDRCDLTAPGPALPVR